MKRKLCAALLCSFAACASRGHRPRLIAASEQITEKQAPAGAGGDAGQGIPPPPMVTVPGNAAVVDDPWQSPAFPFFTMYAAIERFCRHNGLHIPEEGLARYADIPDGVIDRELGLTLTVRTPIGHFSLVGKSDEVIGYDSPDYVSEPIKLMDAYRKMVAFLEHNVPGLQQDFVESDRDPRLSGVPILGAPLPPVWYLSTEWTPRLGPGERFTRGRVRASVSLDDGHMSAHWGTPRLSRSTAPKVSEQRARRIAHDQRPTHEVISSEVGLEPRYPGSRDGLLVWGVSLAPTDGQSSRRHSVLIDADTGKVLPSVDQRTPPEIQKAQEAELAALTATGTAWREAHPPEPWPYDPRYLPLPY